MNLTDITRETLRGLAGVLVVVEELKEEARADGLSAGALQDFVELKLVRSGLRVLPHDDWRRTPGRPWLYVSVNAMKIVSTYFFSIDVQLKQDISLVRQPDIASSCATWELGSIGFVTAEHLCTKIQDSVDAYLDLFLKDYRAVNEQ